MSKRNYVTVTCCLVGTETDDAVHDGDCPTIDRTGDRGYIDDRPAEGTGRVIRWRPGPYMQDVGGHLWRADRGPYCLCEGCGLAYPRWNGDPCPAKPIVTTREESLIAAGFRPTMTPVPDPDNRPVVPGIDCRCRWDIRPMPPRVSRIVPGCPHHGHLKLVRTRYRALLPDGQVWGESGNPEDFIEGGAGRGRAAGPLTFQRLDTYEFTQPWVSWQPEENHGHDQRPE